MKIIALILALFFLSTPCMAGIGGSNSGLSLWSLFTGGSKGTFICTSGGTITVANVAMQATSLVIISLNTAGGTISTAPTVKTVSVGTNFQALCANLDTATYNYMILN